MYDRFLENIHSVLRHGGGAMCGLHWYAHRQLQMTEFWKICILWLATELEHYAELLKEAQQQLQANEHKCAALVSLILLPVPCEPYFR